MEGVFMNYYYDVILNFNMDEFLKFYEWEKDDDLLTFQKIPLFRVSFETLCDFLQYEIKMAPEFLDYVEHRAIVKRKEEEIFAAFLISDTKNSFGVLMDEKGNINSLSSLSLEDDNNLSEFMYTIKEKSLSYEKGKKRFVKKGNRQEKYVKRLISVELKTLLEENNVDKIQYLYYEWFNEVNDNVLEMISSMEKELEKPINEKMKEIYYIIRLSYHQV